MASLPNHPDSLHVGHDCVRGMASRDGVWADTRWNPRSSPVPTHIGGLDTLLDRGFWGDDMDHPPSVVTGLEYDELRSRPVLAAFGVDHMPGAAWARWLIDMATVLDEVNPRGIYAVADRFGYGAARWAAARFRNPILVQPSKGMRGAFDLSDTGDAVLSPPALKFSPILGMITTVYASGEWLPSISAVAGARIMATEHASLWLIGCRHVKHVDDWLARAEHHNASVIAYDWRQKELIRRC